jgi:signal transduction histidine kinase
MAAHDLRTPLAAIKMRADNIRRRFRTGDKPGDAAWDAVVLGISRSAESAFSLIDDVLAVERLEFRDAPAAPPPAIDVERVVHEAVVHQREVLDRAGCKVTVFRKKGLERACGTWDRGYLLRVLWNLLRNTARHAPGAPVHITLARRGDRLGMVYADRGPGLPEDADQLAGRSGADREVQAASHGLGLWIVRRAVDHLNGRLRVRSTPGRGVAFDIELPGLEA